VQNFEHNFYQFFCEKKYREKIKMTAFFFALPSSAENPDTILPLRVVLGITESVKM
jgi:hypothetical protein